MPESSHNFAGLSVAAFESRRADDVARMIERYQGRPFVSPSMRESTAADERPAIEFAHRLIAGQVDAVLFLTGVGARRLLEIVSRHMPRQRFFDALSDVKTIVRGPKPLAVLKEWGLPPTIVAPEPNTWREVLAELDAKLPVANLTIAVQEYGVPNVSLTAGLEARGARVEAVHVYQWDLPEDVEPLRANVRRIVDGEIDVAMFTSAQQVRHLLQVAADMDLEPQLRTAMRQVTVASVGPTTSETLRACDLPVDFEPSHPKLGHLVSEAAAAAATLVQRKQSLAAALDVRPATPSTGQPLAPWHDSPFMRACRREPVPYTPVWLMRQAGRYMAEYREVRAGVSFLELCRNPQLCSEVMCTAVDKLGVDAAIIFSDLLPILQPMGLDLEFAPGDGPQIHNPVREASDVDRFLELESVDSLHYVFETVAQTRRDLPDHLPLIGFAGAPFTLASYAIEGGGSRNYLHAKTLMYRATDAWHELMGRLARSIARYLNAQIAAGAQAVQLFDSWVGCLGPDDYRTFVMPHVKALVAELTPGTPLIHFGTGNPALLPLMAEAGGDVIGLDWRVELAAGWEAVGHDRAVQGNLDPTVLLADPGTIKSRVADVLSAAAGRPGHIFNLGHGVLQQTPVENAQAVVQLVHELSAR
ncbi:MAG: uroporphyrinogen decarboxylase [Planctomycetaceae bacterium]|nr:uroporphyrinogen decarboxylase [Planctomycetaceae bacterium]